MSITDERLNDLIEMLEVDEVGIRKDSDTAKALRHYRELRAGREDVAHLNEVIGEACYELAGLIPVPSLPETHEWPCENPADRECLQKAYVGLRAASGMYKGALSPPEVTRERE